MVLTVEGMSCDGCKNAVERVVGKLPGVTAARVSLAERRLEVDGEPARDAVVAAVTKAGYRVVDAP